MGSFGVFEVGSLDVMDVEEDVIFEDGGLSKVFGVGGFAETIIKGLFGFSFLDGGHFNVKYYQL